MRPGSVLDRGGLFGRGVRERVAHALAYCDGPVHLADLARALGLYPTAVGRAVRHFERCGLVRASRRSPSRTYVVLDSGHPCHLHFRELLRALGPRPASLPDWKNHRHGLRCARKRFATVRDLFVSATATRILVATASIGTTDARDLATLFASDEAGVLYSVRRLVSAGILARGREWKRKPLTLDADFPAAEPLRRFLASLARHGGYGAKFAALSSRREGGRRGPVRAAVARATPRRTPLMVAASLVPVSHPAHVKLMLTLALRGESSAAEMARVVRRGVPGCRSTAQTLADHGLLTVRERPARHGGREFAWSLNSRHALHTALRGALLGAAKAARLTIKRGLGPQTSRGPRCDGLPPDFRSRRAILRAVLDGPVTIGALRAKLRVPGRTLRRRAPALIVAGLIRLRTANHGVLFEPAGVFALRAVLNATRD